ncbi:MAG: ATP synthase F1 subunit delta [Holosporales bacterium]|nr:ATP synthase F1 subunit delta [Holosporales bacterium]
MNLNNLTVLFASLPGRYSKALFIAGKKFGCLEEIIDNFSKLDIFFKNHPSLKKLLTSGCINTKDLTNGWRALGDYLAFCPVFLSFVRQLVVNKRFDLINKIWHIYNIAFAKFKNKRNVTVVSAVELLPEQKERIRELVAKIFKEKAIIKYKIDERILAGVKISSEEIIMDASAFAQLKQLSQFYKRLRIESTKK